MKDIERRGKVRKRGEEGGSGGGFDLSQEPNPGKEMIHRASWEENSKFSN